MRSLIDSLLGASTGRALSALVIFLIVLSASSIFTGCATEEDKRRWRHEEATEANRRNAMSPRERCMEDAVKARNSCDLQCTLAHFKDAQARNYCQGQCQQKQAAEYQLCQYKR
jgi:hypothetical protein